MLQMLWADSTRPKVLQELTYHQDINGVLNQLSTQSDFPHLILYGPDGSGKKTRAMCFTAAVFGNGIYKMKSEERSFKLPNTSTQVEYSILTSNHHIELTPSDNDHQDRHIIQHVVKEIASSQNVESNAKNNGKNFKLLIINEADRLTKEAQGGLRRTMEKYIANCRIIMICEYVHKLILPIRSRCVNIRVPAPTKNQIVQNLRQVAKANIFDIGSEQIQKIAEGSNRNMRVALMQLQLSKHAKETLVVPPFRQQIREIYKKIMKEQSASELQSIRSSLYDLLVNCIEGSDILKELMLMFVKERSLKEECIKEIIHQAAEHETSMILGSKPIIHLESFCAHVMQQVMISKGL